MSYRQKHLGFIIEFGTLNHNDNNTVPSGDQLILLQLQKTEDKAPQPQLVLCPNTTQVDAKSLNSLETNTGSTMLHYYYIYYSCTLSLLLRGLQYLQYPLAH